MRDGGVCGINFKLRNLMTNMRIVKRIFHFGPFLNRLVAGRFLRST
jgi:hypothetical protein